MTPNLTDHGEPLFGNCERTAFYLQVTPAGGGSVAVGLSPGSPFCSHGQLKVTNFAAG
jgi:hypothetical protein